tara:strand:+ start:431 stop:1570 length:1140 start_codon:yes stop_codon:yes gene_type:complete
MAIFKININTPVYIKVANDGGGTEANALADCNLDISIYTGTYQTSPSLTYQLRKNEVSNNNFVIFEIGELIKDFIEYSFSGSFGNNGLNVWVKTVATPRNTAGTALDAITTNMLAFDGVGYFEDGFTTETQTNNNTTLSLSTFKGSTTKLMSNDTIFRESQEILKIPVLANLSVNSGADTLTGATTVNFKNGSTTISSVTVGTGIDTTNTAIEYATSTTASLTSVDVVTGGSTETIKVEEQTCQKFDNIPVIFVNRFGALQRINFFLKSIESININREEYKANTLTTGATYSINNAQYKTRNITSRENIILNTGYVNDSYNQVIEELLMTPRCWIFKDNKHLPVIPENKQVTFQTSLNDKLANYTINFNFAFDKLNTIR